MRLRTIWTWHGLTLHERLSRTSELFWRTLARHLPKRLAYWSFIVTGGGLMTSDEVVPEVRYTDLLARMGKR